MPTRFWLAETAAGGAGTPVGAPGLGWEASILAEQQHMPSLLLLPRLLTAHQERQPSAFSHLPFKSSSVLRPAPSGAIL